MRRLRMPPVVLAALMYSPAAPGGNGLNAIGFGTESVAMAGADTAVARDAFALSINPAGLVLSRSRAVAWITRPSSSTAAEYATPTASATTPASTTRSLPP